MQLDFTEGRIMKGLALLIHPSRAALSHLYRKKEEISIKMAAKYRTKKTVSQVIDSGCQVSGAGPSKYIFMMFYSSTSH